MSYTFTSELQQTLDIQVHRLATNLIFDEHGMSPYYGLVSAFEPDHDETLDNIEALDSEFLVDGSSFWQGQLADPTENVDDGLYEYQYKIWEDDGVEDRGVNLQLRPGYPDPVHVETGDPIGGMPKDCPESIRIQAEATNLTQTELMRLIRAWAEHIGLNPDYFCEAHDWSSIYGLETYIRVHRDAAIDNLVGKGGVLEHIAGFSNGRGKGEHKWDHEDVVGKREAVSLDPDSWQRLIPDQTLAKTLKCYQPKHVRKEETDDPLYHHKLEAQFWRGYYPRGHDDASLPWDGYEYAVDELKQTVLCALNWAEFPLTPDPEVYVEDQYFSPQLSDEEVEIVANPMPDLKQQEQVTARESLMDPDATRAEWEVVAAMTDGGPRNHQKVADASGTSSSTVYRASERFDDVMEIVNGEVKFLDDVVRETITDVVERFNSAKENAFESIRRVADRANPLSRNDGEPSALERWANRHGITARKSHQELKFELDRPVSKHEIQKIIRAGLEAAEGSGLLTSRFEDAILDWVDAQGNPRKGYKMIIDDVPLGIETSG